MSRIDARSVSQYYDLAQFERMVESLAAREGLDESAYVVPTFEQASADLWGGVFRRVICLRLTDSPSNDNYRFKPSLNGRVYRGEPQMTDFLYRFRDLCAGPDSGLDGKLRVLVVNDWRPEVSIANYFIFKKILATPAAVVFAHGPQDASPCNDRLVRDLEGGVLDSTTHRFEHMRDSGSGQGFSIEFLG